MPQVALAPITFGPSGPATKAAGLAAHPAQVTTTSNTFHIVCIIRLDYRAMHHVNKSLVLLMVLLNMNVTNAASLDPEHEKQIDRAVAAGMELEMTPGAVIAAGRADGIVFQKAYGRMTYEPNAKPMTVDTVFDLASLSKTIGCATSIMILAERGKLDVSDPVSKYIPGMDRDDKRDITIEQLLLHRGGFVGDNPMKDFKNGPEEALQKIYAR